MVSCIEHHNRWVREAAVQAVSSSCMCDNGSIAIPIAACLEDEYFGARGAAVIRLPEIVGRGNTEIVGLAMSYLSNPNWYARQAALNALAKIASIGDLDVLGVVIAALKDDDRLV